MRLQHIKLPQSILDIQKEIEITQEKKQSAVKNQNFELAASSVTSRQNLNKH